MSHPQIDEQITFLYTRDLAASAHFYEQVMGLQLVRDQGICRIYRAGTGSAIGICERPGAPVQPNSWDDRSVIVTLVTEDVDGWYAHLTAQGVTFEKPPQHNERFQIYHCVLRDPNNYIIEIQQFLDNPHGG